MVCAALEEVAGEGDAGKQLGTPGHCGTVESRPGCQGEMEKPPVKSFQF